MTKDDLISIDYEKSNLDIGEFGDEFCNYSGHHYIYDVITEIADSNTSIYYSDISEFMQNNMEWVERAIDEFGWDGCGSDLNKAGQMGEYLKNSDDLYTNLDDIMLNYCYNYIMNDLKINELTEEQQEELTTQCTNVDNNDTLDTFEEFCNDLFKKEEE